VELYLDSPIRLDGVVLSHGNVIVWYLVKQSDNFAFTVLLRKYFVRAMDACNWLRIVSTGGLYR